MGIDYEELRPAHRELIDKSHVFFVASAPLNAKHINVSPKGYAPSSLRVLSPTRIAYLDLSGSGAETAAHLHEHGNGRITLMWTEFEDGPHTILRVYGTHLHPPANSVHTSRSGVDAEEYSEWLEHFTAPEDEDDAEVARADPQCRGVVLIDVFKVRVSCGRGVPRMVFQRQRSLKEGDLVKFHREQSAKWKDFDEGLQDKWRRLNTLSNDGLPALKSARGSIAATGAVVSDSGSASATHGWIRDFVFLMLGVVIATAFL